MARVRSPEIEQQLAKRLADQHSRGPNDGRPQECMAESMTNDSSVEQMNKRFHIYEDLGEPKYGHAKMAAGYRLHNTSGYHVKRCKRH
jgi:hypothetical protein